MNPTSTARTLRLLLLWELLGIPCIALTTGALFAAFGNRSGFFFSLPPAAALVIAGGYGAVYAALRCIPHFFMLYLWVMASRFFGDVDVSRARLAIGMTLWALPEAIVFAKLGGGGAFFPTLLTLALAGWLPRALVKALRPGVFQQP